MATVYDVEAGLLIKEAAKKLEGLDKVSAPVWAGFVKTGTSKQMPPVEKDWWYMRAAAILRTIYRSNGPIGVQKLRVKYGSKKNRGHKPEKFFKASGKIIRLVLQQLESEELIKKADVGVHKGRVIAPKGRSFLDKIASNLSSSKKAEKPAPAKPAAKAPAAKAKEPAPAKEPAKEPAKAEPKKQAEEKNE